MNIPTAEEYLNELVPIGALSFESATEAMIEFAKLHVQAQTEAILEKIALRKEESNIIRNIVCNSYPLNKIK